MQAGKQVLDETVQVVETVCKLVKGLRTRVLLFLILWFILFQLFV